MEAMTELPFKVAVTVAFPTRSPVTGISTEICPAGTVTDVGTSIIVGTLLLKGTFVSVCCAALIVSVRCPVAPVCTSKGLGRSETRVGGCGNTFTVACTELVPMEAVTNADPTCKPLTVKVALICPAGTVTVLGTCTIAGLSATNVTSVLVNWATLSVTVNCPVAPTTIGKGEGNSETTSDGGGVTCTAASAVVPFNDTCTITVPSPTVSTKNETDVCPAKIVTWLGTVTMPLGVAVTGIDVLMGWAAEIVAVKVTVPPRSTGFVGGKRDTIVGRFGVMVTLLLAVDPFRLAVI